MPTLTVDSVRAAGVTFVQLLIDADGPHRVRITVHADGPVWPPREDGRPEAGWDGDAVTTRIDAGTTPFGFATPVPPADVDVELADATPLRPGGAPEGVRSWLERVEGRVETAERLAEVDDLPGATREVASVGGLAGLDRLGADLARDCRVLSRLSVAPDELEERLEAVDVPTDTYARLAGADDPR